MYIDIKTPERFILNKHFDSNNNKILVHNHIHTTFINSEFLSDCLLYVYIPFAEFAK